MTTHYLKIALRNIFKYKVQSIICVLSIAVSATLLAVVSSFLLLFTPSPVSRQPFVGRVYRLTVIDHETQPVLRHSFTGVERMMTMDCVSRAASVETEGRKATLTVQFTSPEFLSWYGYRSSITGEPLPVLKKGEVLLPDRLALALFGTLDARGRTLKLGIAGDPTGEVTECRVADIFRPSFADRTELGNNIYVCRDADDFMYPDIYFLLREGTKAEAIKSEILKSFGFEEENVRLTSLKLQCDSPFNRTLWLLRDGLIAFLALFLAMSVASYMRMQAQLFNLRQREIALRTVVGSKRWQLLVLFGSEVLIILSLALVTTLVCNTLLHSYLQEHATFLLSQVYWPMDDFTAITLATYALTAALCLAVVWAVIRRIRSQQTGLAMQMRPQRGSGMKVATLFVQLLLSSSFIAVVAAILFCLGGMKERYDIPANDDFYKQCFLMEEVSSRELGEEKSHCIFDAIQRCEEVESILPFSRNACVVKTDTCAHGELTYCFVQYQDEDEMLCFFAINPTVVNQHANPRHCVYVEREVKEAMERGRTWDGGVLTINDVPYDVAGYFNRLPYHGVVWGKHIIITDPDRKPRADSYVVVPKPGRHRALSRALTEIYAEVIPEFTSIKPVNFREAKANFYTVVEVIVRLFYILAAISVVTTVASLYSVVALDTRRCRKEVALRKIHGATTSVIARLFARRYIIICSVCFVLIIPLCLALPKLGEQYDVGVAWWQIWISAVSVVTAIVFSTIWWKIRGVMHINPVEWINKE